MQARLAKIRERFSHMAEGNQVYRTRAVVGILVVTALIVAGFYYLAGLANTNDKLSSSGAIEATEIRIAPEIGGKVTEVLVDEGDHVDQGQVLLRLDDAVLQNQREQAVAGVAQAQAAAAGTQLELELAQQAYDALFDGLDLATAAALQEVADSRNAVDEAQRHVTNLMEPGKDTDISSAQASVVLTRNALDKAKDDFEPYANKPEDNLVRANLQLRLSQAQAAYDDAVRRLNNLEGSADSIDLGMGQANLEVARARLAHAEDDYAALNDGPDPDKLTLAQDSLAQARAGQTAAQANLAAAQATLDSADLQIAKATILAPAAGTVLYQNIQPGELANPGMVVIVLARLDQLTITVFLPEDKYGQVSLGDKAELETDSFPGEVFAATVTRIADQAEFTPRNVQTGEGRRTTVFAIELRLDDPQGRLKPGMPADVYFSR